MKKGLVVCHGRKHNPIDQKYLDMPTKWIYLDISSDSEPDIVGDFTDLPFLSSVFSLESFDYILLYNCPIGLNLNERKEAFYKSAYQLLKPGGLLIEHRGMFFFFVDLKESIKNYEVKVNQSNSAFDKEMEKIRLEKAGNMQNFPISEEEIKYFAIERVLNINKIAREKFEFICEKLNEGDKLYFYIVEQFFGRFAKGANFSSWYFVGPGSERIYSGTDIAYVK